MGVPIFVGSVLSGEPGARGRVDHGARDRRRHALDATAARPGADDHLAADDRHRLQLPRRRGGPSGWRCSSSPDPSTRSWCRCCGPNGRCRRARLPPAARAYAAIDDRVRRAPGAGRRHRRGDRVRVRLRPRRVGDRGGDAGDAPVGRDAAAPQRRRVSCRWSWARSRPRRLALLTTAPGWYSAAILVVMAAVAATRPSRWYVTPTFTTFIAISMLVYANPADAQSRFNERVGETLLGVALGLLLRPGRPHDRRAHSTRPAPPPDVLAPPTVSHVAQ